MVKTGGGYRIMDLSEYTIPYMPITYSSRNTDGVFISATSDPLGEVLETLYQLDLLDAIPIIFKNIVVTVGSGSETPSYPQEEPIVTGNVKYATGIFQKNPYSTTFTSDNVSYTYETYRLNGSMQGSYPFILPYSDTTYGDSYIAGTLVLHRFSTGFDEIKWRIAVRYPE